jgi:1-hydroxycarotenoid 3,4-desaturase
MANAPGSASGPSDAWRRLGDVTLERAVSSGLLTDAEVLWTRTPADLASRYPRTGGALYGAASNGMFSAFQRPPNRVTRVPGLYLASGSAHPGGGVPMCVLSGRAAARAILEDRP